MYYNSFFTIMIKYSLYFSKLLIILYIYDKKNLNIYIEILNHWRFTHIQSNLDISRLHLLDSSLCTSSTENLNSIRINNYFKNILLQTENWNHIPHAIPCIHLNLYWYYYISKVFFFVTHFKILFPIRYMYIVLMSL